MKKKTIIFVATSCLLIIFGGFFFFKSSGRDKISHLANESGKGASSPKAIVKNASLQEFKPAGKQGWIIKAEDMLIDQAGNEAECHNVSCSIYLDEHNKLDFEAQNLHLNKKTRNLTIDEHFEARYKEALLSSTKLIYNFEQKVIEIPESTTITHPLMHTEAGTITAFADDKLIHLEKGVTTRLFLASTSSNKRSN